MTVHEYYSGLSVTFYFSNIFDADIFRLFVENLKCTVGVIESKVFMLDDVLTFFNT